MMFPGEAMKETDEQLYDEFLRNSSEEALMALIKRHRGNLVLFINGFVHDTDTAEEIAIDAFSEVAAGWTFFSGRSSFRTWLFSIGRNRALMRLRKVIPADDLEEKDIIGAQSPEIDILKSEQNRQLYEGLSKINEDYRHILVLLFFEEMSHEEAACVMGKSRKQIYNLAERGKRALREELLKMGFEYEIGQ